MREKPLCTLIYQMTFITKGPVVFMDFKSGFSICMVVFIGLTFHAPDEQVVELLHCTLSHWLHKTGFTNHFTLSGFLMRKFIKLLQLWCCSHIWIGNLNRNAFVYLEDKQQRKYRGKSVSLPKQSIVQVLSTLSINTRLFPVLSCRQRETHCREPRAMGTK